MGTNQQLFSKRNLLIIAGLAGLLLAILYVAYKLRPAPIYSVGDRPIVIKGGSLIIESKTPFDSDGYEKLTTKQLDHKKSNNQIKCVKMLSETNQKIHGAQCEGLKCEIKVYYAQPDDRDKETRITVRSLFPNQRNKGLRIDSWRVRLDEYIGYNMTPPGKTVITHRADGDHETKKLVRVEIARDNIDLTPWDCPPGQQDKYQCTINIEYTDEAGEANCEQL